MTGETRKMLRGIEKEGWIVTHTKGQHIKLTHPLIPCHPVFTGSTPSDRRTEQNLRAQMRRALRGRPDLTKGTGISPLPSNPQLRTTNMANRLLQFFAYAHLPPHLQAVSKPFGDLAQHLDETLPSNAESTVALRKLLESKDCAVRAVLEK